MEQIYRWWQNRNLQLITLATGVIVILIIAGYWVEGTGFGGYTTTSTTTEATPQGSRVTVTEQYQRGKTLWDWMDLLIAPAILAIGTTLLTWFTRERRNEEAERRKLEAVAAQQVQRERETAVENQREAALQTYLDRLSELLIHQALVESAPDSNVRAIAMARTLSTLSALDPARRAIVVHFLYDAQLILTGKVIISLEKANLEGVFLTREVS